MSEACNCHHGIHDWEHSQIRGRNYRTCKQCTAEQVKISGVWFDTAPAPEQWSNGKDADDEARAKESYENEVQ